MILVTRPGDGPYLPRSSFAPVSEGAVRDPSPVSRHPLSPLGWAHPVSGPSHPLLVPVSAIALHRPERPGLSLICSSHPLSPSPHPPSTFLSTPGRLVPRNVLPKLFFLSSHSLPICHPFRPSTRPRARNETNHDALREGIPELLSRAVHCSLPCFNPIRRRAVSRANSKSLPVAPIS